MTPILHLSLPVTDLAESRSLYVDTLGCRLGRVRDDWIDVWLYGLQLTLQERPDEVLAPGAQGVRHFGVALDRDDLAVILERLEDAPVAWLMPLTTATDPTLNGKTSVLFADTSGIVIELKSCSDPSELVGLPDWPS